MSKLKLASASSIGAFGGLLSLLVGCTGVMSGDPKGDAPGGPAGPGPIGGGGSSMVGGGGTTSTTASSMPEVNVMTIRRLNRTGYTNTLQALTGSKQDYGTKFPADDLACCGTTWFTANNEMADSLTTAAYPYRYMKSSTQHGPTMWHFNDFPDGLRWLWKGYTLPQYDATK
jgi:Protein of unknown function (DUF1587)